jgi:superkiller protein 3
LSYVLDLIRYSAHVSFFFPFEQPPADLEFSSRVFSGFKLQPTLQYQDALSSVFSLLDRYCTRCTDDPSALHLFALVCEYLGHRELGVELIQRAISILETAYEESEDAAIERQFTIANCNLARLLLSLKNYGGALESFQSVLGLLPEEVDEQDAVTEELRTQALFGSGLATFKTGDVQGALNLFQDALGAAGDNAEMRGHVTVMLAKVLWAIGTEEGRESAKAQLLEWFVVMTFLPLSSVSLIGLFAALQMTRKIWRRSIR